MRRFLPFSDPSRRFGISGARKACAGTRPSKNTTILLASAASRKGAWRHLLHRRTCLGVWPPAPGRSFQLDNVPSRSSPGKSGRLPYETERHPAPQGSELKKTPIAPMKQLAFLCHACRGQMTLGRGWRAMRHLGLKAKLAAGFGALVAMIIFTGAVGYHSIGRLIAASADVTSSLKQKTAAASIEIGLQKQIRGAVDYAFDGKEASFEQYQQDKYEVSQRLEELGRVLSDEKDEMLLARIRAS